MLRRISLQPDTPSVVLSDPSRVALFAELPDAPFFAVRYLDQHGVKLDLVQRSTLERRVVIDVPESPTDMFETGVVGQFVYYLSKRAGVHLIALDGEANVVDLRVGQFLNSFGACLRARQPSGRLVVRDGNRRLVLVDLRAPAAEILTTIEAEADTALSCPVWSQDARAFAYRQSGAGGTELFTVSWDDSAPGSPELVHSSSDAAAVRVLALTSERDVSGSALRASGEGATPQA